MPSTYDKIQAYTVPSATTSVTLSSISTAYTDLILIVSASSTTTNNHQLRVGNGSVDTGANYSTTILYGDGSSAGSTRTSGNQAYVGQGSTSQFTHVFNFQNYSNTSTFKTFLNRTNVTTAGGWLGANVNLWRSTAAINTIEYFTSAGNIKTGSTFTLYGIKAA